MGEVSCDSAFADLQKGSHGQRYIHIQYRSKNRPPIDGSDLDMLEKLRDVDADEDIACFPWVIHEDQFPELSIHTRIVQKALTEIASQVVSAEAEEEPSIEMTNIDEILRML